MICSALKYDPQTPLSPDDFENGLAFSSLSHIRVSPFPSLPQVSQVWWTWPFDCPLAEQMCLQGAIFTYFSLYTINCLYRVPVPATFLMPSVQAIETCEDILRNDS